MSVPIPEPFPLTPAARRILDAASRLFYDQGIHAVGVDTIAEEAGVTKKTLYDRFGSKEALVVAYLQHRDAVWRDDLAAQLARTPEPGLARVLTIFDAAISWSGVNSPKGCSAINARAEIGTSPRGPVFPEVVRQKAWLLELFTELCEEAGVPDAAGMAQRLMLLYEGAIVTIGMHTLPVPFEVARDIARVLLEPVLNDSK
jgi:AcrR family transcriptional regulator